MTIPVDLSAEALAETVAREAITGTRSLLMHAALQQIVAIAGNPDRSQPYTKLARINRIAREGLS